jgi:hypothetical protein
MLDVTGEFMSTALAKSHDYATQVQTALTERASIDRFIATPCKRVRPRLWSTQRKETA